MCRCVAVLARVKLKLSIRIERVEILHLKAVLALETLKTLCLVLSQLIENVRLVQNLLYPLHLLPPRVQLGNGGFSPLHKVCATKEKKTHYNNNKTSVSETLALTAPYL